MKKDIIMRNGKTVYRTEWNSITEMVSYLQASETNRRTFPGKVSSATGTKSFTMTESLGEAYNLLLNGWEEGSRELTKQFKLENAKIQTKEVKRAIHDIVGFQVSVPRYLQGIPTHMVNQKSVKQKQKIINLVKSISYPARVKPKQILDDSVKFLQIIQEVEKKGIRVNAYVTWHSMKDREEFYGRVKIKSASERLNLSKMSFPLVHPSFLRRICFRALEVEERLTDPMWHFGYGAPGGPETYDLMDKNEYYVPVLVSEYGIDKIFSDIK